MIRGVYLPKKLGRQSKLGAGCSSSAVLAVAVYGSGSASGSAVSHIFYFFVDRTCKILVDFAIFFKKIRKREQNLVKIVLMMTVCVNHDCC